MCFLQLDLDILEIALYILEIALYMLEIALTWPQTKRPTDVLKHNYGKSPFLVGKSTINHHFQ